MTKCLAFCPWFLKKSYFRIFTQPILNKDYVIFSYFRNFIVKSDPEPKTKIGMNYEFLLKKIAAKQLSLPFNKLPDKRCIASVIDAGQAHPPAQSGSIMHGWPLTNVVGGKICKAEI